MKTLEDERYVVIKAYKCTVSEIWRDFLYWHVLRVRRIPTYRLYRVYDSTIITRCRRQCIEVCSADQSARSVGWALVMLCTASPDVRGLQVPVGMSLQTALVSL